MAAINTATHTRHSGNFIEFLAQLDWIFRPMNVVFAKVKQQVQNFVNTSEHSVLSNAMDVSKRVIK